MQVIICVFLIFPAVFLVLAELQPEPRYLEDDSVGERVVGGEVARPNSWPWQVPKHKCVHGDSLFKNCSVINSVRKFFFSFQND